MLSVAYFFFFAFYAFENGELSELSLTDKLVARGDRGQEEEIICLNSLAMCN